MSSVVPFHLLPSTSPSSATTTGRPRRWKPSIRTRLSQLCKDGRPDLAHHLFDTLPRPIPTVLWNTLLIGFVCNSMPFDALSLYSQMNSSSPSPPPSDHYTFSSALKACALSRQLLLGRAIHCRILKSLDKKPKNRVLNNSLLNMYASCTSHHLVQKLFDEMPKRNTVSWNTLISWYTKNSKPADALSKFNTMLRRGIKPTPLTFVHAFPAASALGEIAFADSLYAFLVKLGGDFISDLFAVSSAISMYSDLSDIESASRVFDSAVSKNIEVWNSMIGGYIENDLPEKALDLFVRIFETDGSTSTEPDVVTLVEALMAASQSQNARSGRQIHAHAIKRKGKLPVILSNALAVMYSRCGSLEDAFGIFNQMEERDVVSWNTMISSCVQNGMNLEGSDLVRRMQEEGHKIDSVTVTASLSAASNLGDIRIGKETHAYLIRHGIECVGMDSYLIDMYSKSGSVGIASRLFDMDRKSSNKDRVTWNAMISGYVQSDRTDEAICVLRQMLEENVEPNAVTFASILPVCSNFGGIRMGKQLHGYSVRHLLHENVFVSTAMVDLYSKCGKIMCAERVFDGMDDKNSVTYTTMISGYGQHGLGDRALSLFRMMLESGMKPDGVTFVAIMAACSYTGLVEEGLEIFQSMERDYGILATPEHHCCIVDLLGRAGRVEEAYELALELGEEGNNVGVWGSLLAACRIHGEFELGKVVEERLFEVENKVGSQAGYHVLLSNVYAAQKRWESVDKLRKDMREKGLTKEPGSSWIEVGDRTHKFMSKDQNHPEQDQMHLILNDLVTEMKFAGSETGIEDHFEEEFEVLE